MSSINIAQLLPSLETGGVERGVVDLSNHLSNKRIKNHIISSGGRLEKNLNDKYTTHHKLNVTSKNFLLFPLIANEINNLLKKYKINILHTRSRGPAWMVNLISNKKFKTVSTFHNVYNGSSYIKKTYNKGLAQMDYIVANSNFVKEAIIEKYNLQNKDIKVIPRGVDIDFFNIRKRYDEIDQFKYKIEFDKNKKIIFFPGRITSWKGQKEFLKVIIRLQNDNYLFYFAGGATNKRYYQELKNEIKVNKLDNVCKVLGNLNSLEFRCLLNLSHIVLSLPTSPEGFGRIVSEALSMNKVVFGFDYGGVRDQLKDLDPLFRIKPYDYDEIFLKIKKLENFSKDEINNLTKDTRKHVENNFSLKNMLENYENLYQSIIN
mgnify:CR=1 FL=1